MVKNQPLVSILMPVYNSRYFEEALLSAISQTYKNLEIVISDDSPNGEIRNIVEKYKNESLRYIKNDPAKGPFENYVYCLKISKGKYIKFLNDDDLLSSSCVDKMVIAFEKHENLAIVTSARECIDGQGNSVTGHMSTLPIFKTDTLIRGMDMYTSMVQLRLNLVGEPTTTMFEREKAISIVPNFMHFAGKPGYGAGDMAVWLNLLRKGDVYYYSEYLSKFRLHDAQRQKSAFVRERSSATWEWFKTYSKKEGLLTSRLGWFVSCYSFDMKVWKIAKIVNITMVLRQFLIMLYSVMNKYRK